MELPEERARSIPGRREHHAPLRVGDVLEMHVDAIVGQR
jgi:hypothetical protein